MISPSGYFSTNSIEKESFNVSATMDNKNSAFSEKYFILNKKKRVT